MNELETQSIFSIFYHLLYFIFYSNSHKSLYTLLLFLTNNFWTLFDWIHNWICWETTLGQLTLSILSLVLYHLALCYTVKIGTILIWLRNNNDQSCEHFFRHKERLHSVVLSDRHNTCFLHDLLLKLFVLQMMHESYYMF